MFSVLAFMCRFVRIFQYSNITRDKAVRPIFVMYKIVKERYILYYTCTCIPCKYIQRSLYMYIKQ